MEYGTDILNLLQSLELQRTQELKKFGMIVIFVLIVNILFFINFRSNFLLSLAGGFLVLVGSYYVINNSYKAQVQNTLIPKLIKKIDPNFTYSKDDKVDLDLINSFKFFAHKIEKGQSSGSIGIKTGKKSADFSFVTLESMRVDTEGTEHFTKRFEGLFLTLDDEGSYDQNYLIAPRKKETPTFEAGDYLNPPEMGLKLVGSIADGKVLYSQNAQSRLNSEIVQKVLNFCKDLKRESWIIFDKNIVYIFVENISGGFEASLFLSLMDQNFIGEYVRLTKAVKELLGIQI